MATGPAGDRDEQAEQVAVRGKVPEVAQLSVDPGDHPVHVPSIASALGPVHGFCYLVVIALAWQLPAPTRVRALSLVPAVGGLLVLRAAPAR